MALGVVIAVLAGCRRFAAPSAAETTPLPTPAPLAAPSWRTYAEPPARDDWAASTLDDARWVRVSADLACAGRALHGDPDAHHQAARRILFHHQTHSAAVMDYGIGVNQDSRRALKLGAEVATAVEACR